MKPLSQLSLDEIRALDATAIVKASLVDQQERGAPEIRHSEPVTRSLPTKSNTPSGRDLQIIEACMKASGELAGKVRRETDAELATIRKSLLDEITAVRLEITALRAQFEERGHSLKRVA